VFRIGPELHAFEGLVKATIVQADLDWERGSFAGEVDWRNSWEADSHLQLFGVGEDPACWSIVGYASGYVTQFFNRPVIFKETACVACGDAHCHIVGKPAGGLG
jgi:two-component system response regulator HydG